MGRQAFTGELPGTGDKKNMVLGGLWSVPRSQATWAFPGSLVAWRSGLPSGELCFNSIHSPCCLLPWLLPFYTEGTSFPSQPFQEGLFFLHVLHSIPISMHLISLPPISSFYIHGEEAWAFLFGGRHAFPWTGEKTWTSPSFHSFGEEEETLGGRRL